jgi:hypothetical protein
MEESEGSCVGDENIYRRGIIYPGFVRLFVGQDVWAELERRDKYRNLFCPALRGGYAEGMASGIDQPSIRVFEVYVEDPRGYIDLARIFYAQVDRIGAGGKNRR